MTTRSRALLLSTLVAVAVAGCADPVHDDLVASLGPEDPNVPPGPLHRPGQPCLACHDGTGPASMTMIFGGTAYEYYNQPAPLVAAQMSFTDSTMGLQFVTTTNCAGNFWVQSRRLDADLPRRHGALLRRVQLAELAGDAIAHRPRVLLRRRATRGTSPHRASSRSTTTATTR